MKLNTLQDVFVEQLGDLRSAEEQLVQALPKLASAANSPELREAFEHHLEQTQNHVQRPRKSSRTSASTCRPSTAKGWKA